MTYGDNRNVQADGTRQFRYNYKNQLRRVWRKSDGATVGEIAKYRDLKQKACFCFKTSSVGLGRRVHVESKWELSRRTYFDTRFELDVDVDAGGGGFPSGGGVPPGGEPRVTVTNFDGPQPASILEVYGKRFANYLPNLGLTLVDC